MDVRALQGPLGVVAVIIVVGLLNVLEHLGPVLLAAGACLPLVYLALRFIRSGRE